MDSDTIRVLYENVLHDDVKINRVKENEIRIAINNMKEVYKPDPTSLQSDVVDVADYDDVVHRCAYLHKYAPLHTALVSEMLQLAMQRNAHIFQAIINKHGSFNLCSLGGGPGSDVIGVLDVLHSVLGYFHVNATIVDIMVGWKYTFENILKELRYGDYGPLSEHVSDQYFSWSYEGANLLSKMTAGSNRAIASANLITMVKFVSASSCKDTASMIGEIFRRMNPGALVLFIDNDGGRFYRLVAEEAKLCNFKTLFLLEHYSYLDEVFKGKKRGLQVPCHETKVTACLWRKPRGSCSFQHHDPPTESNEVLPEEMPLRNIPVSIVNPTILSPSVKKRSKPKQDKLRHAPVVSPKEHNPEESPSWDGNQNGSSTRNSDEGNNWDRFVRETGKKWFWSLCKTAVSHVLLPLLELRLSRHSLISDDVAPKGKDLAEYFFECLPSDWN